MQFAAHLRRFSLFAHCRRKDEELVAQASGKFVGAARFQDRYRILAKLGSGGMADVFLGMQLGEEYFQRLVVIKRIHTRWLKSQDALRMFVAEAQTIASLNHPHIVKMFDLARLDGDVCIAMEYVAGENLEYIRKAIKNSSQQIPLPIVCRIMIEACEALHYAHTATAPDGTPLDLVHRDVSPRNLILDDNGYLKVIDFGIAKSSIQPDLTSPGMIKGNFSYLSPDLFQFEKIDCRADIYSLGLVFFELVTLRRAVSFRKDVSVAEVIKRVLDVELPEPSVLAPEIPKEIDMIVAMATQKDRAQRYQTCEQMATDIQNVAVHACGLANNRDVEHWLQKTLKKRVSKRREFERNAIKKSQNILQQETIEADSPIHSYDQLDVSNRNMVSGYHVPLSTSVMLGHDRSSPYMLLIKLFFVFVIGLGIVFYVYREKDLGQKHSTQQQTHSEQGKQAKQKIVEKNLWVGSIPPNAVVAIDGTKVGSTGQFGIELHISPDTQHVIEVFKEAYKPYRRKIVGEQFAKRKVVAELIALPQPSAKKPEPRPKQPKVPVAVGNTASQPRRRTSFALRLRRKRAARRKNKIAMKTNAFKDEPKQWSQPVVEPSAPLVKKNESLPERQKPVEQEVALQPKVRLYSGDGNWSGAQVAKQGCTRCHGSKIPPIDYSTKTSRQWKLFFLRRRHNRHVKLRQHFSQDELHRVMVFIQSQIKEDWSPSGIAGVK